MKRSIRLLALVLALMLATAGCGTVQETPTPTAAAQTAPATDEPVTVSVDTESPLQGDVIIAVNTSVSADSLLPVGVLPADDGNYSMFANLPQVAGIPLDSLSAEPEPAGDRQIVGREDPETSYTIGEKKSFKTVNFYKSMMKSFGDAAFADYDENERIDVDMQLVYVGKYCTVWGQTSAIYNRPDISVSLDEGMAEKIADEFDTKIFPKVTAVFGPLYDADGDGKFAIVCADFIDYYNYEIYDNYFLQGYCNPMGDTEPAAQGGDGTEMDMMVVDIWPTIYNEKNEPADENWVIAMQTVAHEMQHYADYSATKLVPGAVAPDSWIQESMSTFSETLYKGKVADDTFGYYKSDASSLIANGRSPMEFQGRMEDYALVNLFSIYLYEQTKDLQGGGFELFQKIIDSPEHDYQCIEEALKQIGYPVTNFSDLLFNFRVAIVANEDSGVYSFNKNEAVQDLPIHFYQNADGLTDSKALPGGGAIVFKNVEGGFVPDGNDSNIRFAGISLTH